MKALLLFILILVLTVNNALSGDLQKYTLDSASSFVGITEKTGNNDGPQVEAILRYVGLPKGNPYCMATVVYCYHLGAQRAGLKDQLPKYARVSMMWNYANANPFRYRVITKQGLLMKTYKLEPADISIHSRAGGTVSNFNGHTGIVVAQNTIDTFTAIEGNTGGGPDQGEGQGIFKKTRYISKNNGNLGLKGFIRIK
jgi:hypothetical protein